METVHMSNVVCTLFNSIFVRLLIINRLKGLLPFNGCEIYLVAIENDMYHRGQITSKPRRRSYSRKARPIVWNWLHK